MAAEIQEQAKPSSLRRELAELSHQMGELRRQGREIDDALRARHRALTEQLKQRSAEKTPPEAAPPGAPAVELITDRAQLAQLQPQWDDLLERADNYSPFMAWEWWWPWLQHCCTRHEPYVLVARDEQGKLTGALPLTIVAGRRPQLRFMASFDGPDPAYLRIPIDRQAAPETRQLLLHHLALDCGTKFADWRWEQCCVDGSLSDIMTSAGREGLQVNVQVRRQYVHGSLPDSFEEFVANVPSHNRRNLMRHQFARLKRDWGEPEFIVHRELTAEASELVTQMAAYNIKRRQTIGDHSRWDDARFTRCLNEIMEQFSARGWFRLFAIKIEGKLAAAFMGWAYRGTFFSYQIGETEERPELGLGQCAVAHGIRTCIEEGLQHFEFLGEAHDWKRRYFHELTPAATVHVGRDNYAYWSSLGTMSWRRALGRKLREVRHGS